jgi:hypothetical protein
MKQSPPPLDDEQAMAELLAIMARNNLEDLHAGDGEISDRLMKKINQRFRNAIYTGLHAAKSQRRSISARRWVDYHRRSIPMYWEAPELIPGYRDALEPETDGSRPALVVETSSAYKAVVRAVRAMLDRIAGIPDGRAIRGTRGQALRRRLELYGIDRYLKLTTKERRDPGRLRYLEFDLGERLKDELTHPSAS